MPEDELDDFLGPVSATVPLDEAIDRLFDLKLPLDANSTGTTASMMLVACGTVMYLVPPER